MPLNGFNKILVTGAAGFIGSHLADRLLQEDVEVTALDNMSTGRQANIQHNLNNRNYKFIKGDIRDRKQLAETLKGADAVFHEAAQVNITKSLEDPLTTNDINVNGTLNVLKACADQKVRCLVFASSCAVYGEEPTLPKKEDMTPKPISPYAASKLAAENYVTVYSKVYDIRTTSLRYFNVYGPRQTSGPYSGVIPIFIHNLLNNRKITIYGDGDQTRDFVYVNDVVEANIRALTSNRSAGEVFNVATGHQVTVNELVEKLQKVTGKNDVEVVHAAERTGDIRHSYADVSKAERLIGYRPRVDIFNGLSELVEYWRNTRNVA